ncbi:MAG: hypothetical protein Q4E35_10955 [Eubacteriales bacterium]|nr:hypothetical protein [Eubacteriales bacterium]
MWNHLSSYKLSTERKALEIVFNFLWLDMLTNPECNLAESESFPSQGLCFSRDLGTLPDSCDIFRRKVSAADWEAILCVAGTEKSDKRRVVLLYSRSENTFILNFPMSDVLTENEKEIKHWVEKSAAF